MCSEKRDLRNWNCPYEVLRETKGIIDFDHEVQIIAQELAIILERIPAWSADWPIVTPEIIGDITMEIQDMKTEGSVLTFYTYKGGVQEEHLL